MVFMVTLAFGSFLGNEVKISVTDDNTTIWLWLNWWH